MTKTYLDIRKIDVSDHIEKKMNLSYLSWAWAYDEMKKIDEKATYEIKEFVDNDTLMQYAQAGIAITPELIEACKINYKKDRAGAYVEVAVTLNGKTVTESLPVMDFKNKAMVNPTSMDVNKAHKRCFVKALAHHGLGLYIYAGEDLPEEPAEPADKVKPKAANSDDIESRINSGYEHLIAKGDFKNKTEVTNAIKEDFDVNKIADVKDQHVLGWLLERSRGIPRKAK